MPGRQYSPSTDTHAYIPPAMEQAMTQHLQSSLPAHLREYVGQDRPAYIPEHIEKELAQQMQKNMPEHLQQYSAAYLQQRLVKPGLVGLDPYHSAANLPSRPPVPDHLRLDHSMPVGEQFTVQVPGSVSPNTQFSPAAGQQLPQNPVPGTPQPQDFPAPGTPPPNSLYVQQQPTVYPPAAPDAMSHSPEYGFIMSPETVPNRSWSLPGGNSQTKRALTVFGGLFALLIVFIVIKGLLGGGGPNLASFTAVAQDQQELIHLATDISQQTQNASATSQNIAITVQLSITSAQSQLLTYLTNNHESIGTKTLALKVSTSLDNQLTTAAADSTFDQTFQQAIQSKLTTYQQDLKQTYAQTKGTKGRQLLSNDYNGATLLLKQIGSPAS
ncbi:MAG TPA: hypothetical protein VK712_03440 [Verrucomicrobiae bacterium]|nr:hypothetical protein [Verrucomicrobiae bacterium]